MRAPKRCMVILAADGRCEEPGEERSSPDDKNDPASWVGRRRFPNARLSFCVAETFATDVGCVGLAATPYTASLRGIACGKASATSDWDDISSSGSANKEDLEEL